MGWYVTNFAAPAGITSMLQSSYAFGCSYMGLRQVDRALRGTGNIHDLLSETLLTTHVMVITTELSFNNLFPFSIVLLGMQVTTRLVRLWGEGMKCRRSLDRAAQVSHTRQVFQLSSISLWHFGSIIMSCHGACLIDCITEACSTGIRI